jgi:hypothetical protein
MNASLGYALKTLLALALLIVGEGGSARAENMDWPLTALDLAKQRALSVNCVNNLHQIVLAARVSSGASGPFPQGFLSFTNGLDSPAALSCPANFGRPVGTNWASFALDGIDYEWIPQASWDQPTAVCCRCRIHNHVAQVDGAVRQLGGFRRGWPEIVAAPLQHYATPGSEVRFKVDLAPNTLLPVTYQWQRGKLYSVTNVTFVADPEDPNGGFWRTNRQGQFATTLLLGETNSTYVIGNAQTHDSDYYSVVASNALGVTESNPSRLFVDSSVSAMAADTYWSAIHCVNNLKQIALFGRMMANDHDEQMPQSLSTMTNSHGQPIFGWPVVLYCRFDAVRKVPAEWAGVDLGNTAARSTASTRRPMGRWFPSRFSPGSDRCRTTRPS